MVNSDQLAEDLHFIQNSTGGILGPQDSWLLIRGMKTLGIRMEEHERNTKELIVFLENHPAIKKVFYPGLETHPQHDMAKEQYGDLEQWSLLMWEVERKQRNYLNVSSTSRLRKVLERLKV